MNWDVVLTCLLIILARVTDVSMGTVRTVLVVTGRRYIASVVGFFEVLVWVIVVSKVISNLSEPLYAVCYALGFALGTFLGVTIEGRLAFGEQVVRIFSRMGDELAEKLRASGFAVTVMEGQGKDGPIQILFIHARRKRMPKLAELARKFDPACFYVIDDIRGHSLYTPMMQPATGWRATVKRK